MTRINPGRVLTAMVTPLRADGAVDYAQARRLAIALLDSGSDGLVVTGTTGEAPTLTIAEKIRLWGEVKDAVGDRGAVIAGSGDNCTADSIEFSREAARTGVDALLLTVALLQQADAGGPVPPLRRDRRGRRRALHHVQHPRPHRRQHDRRNAAPPLPRAATSSA